MTNTEKLRRAITLMGECQKFKAPFLTTPIALVSEVLLYLEGEDEAWGIPKPDNVERYKLTIPQIIEKFGEQLTEAEKAHLLVFEKSNNLRFVGYLYEGEFYPDADISEFPSNIPDGNHPVPLYRKEK